MPPARRLFVLADNVRTATMLLEQDHGFPRSMWEFLHDSYQLRGRTEIRVVQATRTVSRHPHWAELQAVLRDMRARGHVTWISVDELDGYVAHFHAQQAAGEPLTLPSLPPEF